MSDVKLLRFASLNVRGMNDKNKRLAIFDYFQNSNFSIIMLQETKTSAVNENEIRRDWYNQKVIINSTPSYHSSGGCMILFNKMYDKISILDTILSSDGRYIAVNIDFYGSRYHIINSYFPTDNNEKLPFITCLYPIVSSQYPVVFGGDFNLVLDHKLDRYPSRTTRDTHSNDLQDLVNNFDLEDVCRKTFLNKPFYSFRRGTRKSRIDHFYISKGCEVSNYKHDDFALSDHDIISFGLVVNNSFFLSKEKDFGETLLEFMIRMISWTNSRFFGPKL